MLYNVMMVYAIHQHESVIIICIHVSFLKRTRGRQRMRWLDGITDLMDVNLSEIGDGQGGLACCGSWGHKESDTTERLN